jgi:EmrB/QacA subfamily drug resistance transporter
MENALEKKQDKFLPAEIWVLFSTILASSMAFIDGTALNVALPSIQSNLKANGAQLLWVINGYTLMLAAFILVGGSLGDHFGRKKIFMIGISIFLIASIFCGTSQSIQWMIAARVLQGIGGALMIPGSLAIIASSVAPNRMGKAIGIWSSATTLIFIIGPVLGGFFSDLGFWRGVFFINLPLGILSLLALQYKVQENRDETSSGPIDFLGAGIITIGLAGLAYGFISAPDNGFNNPVVIVPLAIGVIGLAAFWFVESRLPNPMLPFHLFNSRTFAGANLLTLFLYAALNVFSFFLSLNLVQIQGYTKTEAGLAILPFVLMLTILSGWTGSLVDRIGPRLPLIVGPVLAGLGFFLVGFSGVTKGPSDYWIRYLPGILVFGIGMGFTVAPLSTSVMGSVGNNYSGIASGINNAVSRVGGVLAVAIIGSIALIAFARSLDIKTSTLNMSDQAHQQLMVEAAKLGGATVPAEIQANDVETVSSAIKQSFSETFRLVMLICSGLAWISAILSALFVETKLYRQSTKP